MFSLSPLEDFIANLSVQRQFFPTDEDETGAAKALMRLQDTYKLDPDTISKGDLPGNSPLQTKPVQRVCLLWRLDRAGAAADSGSLLPGAPSPLAMVLSFPVGASPLVRDSRLPSAPAPPPPSSPGLPSLSSGNAKAAAQDLLGLCLQSTAQVCIQTHFCSHPPGSSCPGVISEELIVPWPMCPQLQSAPVSSVSASLDSSPRAHLRTSVLAHLTYPGLRIPGPFESLLLIDLFSLLVRQLDSHLHSFCFLGSCVPLNTQSLGCSCPCKITRGHLDGKASRQVSGQMFFCFSLAFSILIA